MSLIIFSIYYRSSCPCLVLLLDVIQFCSVTITTTWLLNVGLYATYNDRVNEFCCVLPLENVPLFVENALLLNPTKSEDAIFGTRQRLSPVRSTVVPVSTVDVFGTDVSFANSVKSLVWRWTLLWLSTILFTLVIFICALRHIRPFLSLDTGTAKSVTLSLRLELDCVTSWHLKF